MQVNIKTAGFEGPLDLLLHLIKHLEIDIYDIPMSEITDQYLLYIHTMKELELDVASEFLVMAATLLAIKSQMLLPKYENSGDDDLLEEEYIEDPREELVSRLIEYRKYKEAANDLKEKEKERSLMFTKPPSDLSDYATNVPVEEIDNKVTIYDMLGAFNKLLRRQKLQKPLHTKVARQEISIEKRMQEVESHLVNVGDWVNFFDLFPYPEKEYIVVTFLAILELMKRDSVEFQQKGNFEEIWLQYKK
ncbi:segregation/condensation protein A [Caldibacillus lycopersici]|uniref:Segregation and condensation protein A n=1 Tax=Perspicuibacillus lycopersici TaxID=1325689 RepID=A0AAE3IXB1_9BACI|nr:segregation/condensation protein A [Perspicuibacillus lycopersici]MCU9613755.1 segregation/condensation protein A [Perspicuibacillus lycopersici]